MIYTLKRDDIPLLSQWIKKEGAVSNANFDAFETALFLCEQQKSPRTKKKASIEAKMNTTKRGSLKSLFSQAMQFRENQN